MMTKLPSLLLLFLSYYSFAQRLYIKNDTQSNKKEEVYPSENHGFLRALINNSSTSQTILITQFNDSKNEPVKKDTLILTKSSYLGHASNGLEHHLIFLDDFNNWLYTLRYTASGSFIENRKDRLKKNINHVSIIYSDKSAYYTIWQKASAIILTKISFKTDTLWETKIIQSNTNKLFKTVKCNGDLLLVFMGEKGAVNIHSLSDSDGSLRYSKDVGASSRSLLKFLTEENKNSIIQAGFETIGKGKKAVKGIYIIDMNEECEILSHSFYDLKKIKISEKELPLQVPQKRLKNLMLRDVIRTGDQFTLILEDFERTDFRGEGLMIGVATKILIGGTFIATPETIINTYYDLFIARSHIKDDSLNLIRLEKEPISKFAPSIQTLSNLSKSTIYDYKFSRDTNGGKELIFFQNLTDNELVLGSVKISSDFVNPLIVKKYPYKQTTDQVYNYSIYPLNENSLLLEIISNLNKVYKVIDYDDFH